MKNFTVAALVLLVACSSTNGLTSGASPTLTPKSSRSPWSPTPLPADWSPTWSPGTPAPSTSPTPANRDHAKTAEICNGLQSWLDGSIPSQAEAMRRVDEWRRIALTMYGDRYYVRADVLLLWASANETFPDFATVQADAERLAKDCGRAGFHVDYVP